MDGDEGRSGPLPVRAPAIRSKRRAFLLLPRPSRTWIPAARKAAFLEGKNRRKRVYRITIKPRAGLHPIDPPQAIGREVRQVERGDPRSEEHTSELQSLMRISYAVFCL